MFDNSNFGSMNSSKDVANHDHSSDAEGGATLNPVDLATKETPVVDVRRYGVTGDGETDDADAFQAAVNAATPRGIVHVPYDLDVYFESPIDVDLGLSDAEVLDGGAAQTPFALVVEGRLLPAAGLGDGIHVHHGQGPYVDVRVQGGGALDDTAIRVSDVRGGVFEGISSGYDGTLFGFDNGTSVTTGVTVGTVQTQFTGQPLHLAPGPDSPHDMLGGDEGFGSIRDVWEAPPVHCSTFRSVRGLGINQYENAVDTTQGTERGVLFEGCEDVAIDKMAIGGVGDIPELVTFKNCRNVDVSSVFAQAIGGSGVVIDSVQHSNFDRLWVYNLGAHGVDYRQSGSLETRNNRVVVDANNNDGHGLVVRDTVTGADHDFTGKFLNNDVEINAARADRIRITNADSNTALSLAPDADVRIAHSYFPSVDGEPKTRNYVGESSGARSTPDASRWAPGDVVFHTDTDGDGSGVYLLDRGRDWVKIGDQL